MTKRRIPGPAGPKRGGAEKLDGEARDQEGSMNTRVTLQPVDAIDVTGEEDIQEVVHHRARQERAIIRPSLVRSPLPPVSLHTHRPSLYRAPAGEGATFNLLLRPPATMSAHPEP